jgi:DUF1680 family protein
MKKQVSHFFSVLVILLLSMEYSSGSTGPAEGCSDADPAKTTGDVHEAGWIPVDAANVTLGGEIGRRIENTIRNNLLVLDPDRDFLDPFRAKDRTSGYIGLGKLIDATVRFAWHTGDPEVLKLKNYLVSETLAIQEKDGYIGMFEPESRMWSLWDIHEMAYIIYGLATDYAFYAQSPSLDAAVLAAEYILERWDTMPEDWGADHVAPHVAVTGLERAMLALYKLTDQHKFLDFCVRERALPEWDLDIVIGRLPGIKGHIYAYMARCLAQLELYAVEGDENLCGQSDRAVHFLAAQDGMAITGCAGQWEIWTDDQDGYNALGETCATAYQLRVYNQLLCDRHEPAYGEMIERTVYNGLFGAQSPEGRQIRYYTPLEGPRKYHPGDSYCCPNNFRRIIAELPSMVYYKTSDGGIAVNLFTESEAKVEIDDLGSLEVRQQTDYPNSGRVEIMLNPETPGEFPVYIRIPMWAEGSEVWIDGSSSEKQKAEAGTLVKINRTWNAGERIVVDMPMQWRLVQGRKHQAGRVAVMRGPLVYCLNPEKNPSLDPDQVSSRQLGRLIIDPASIEGPVADDSVRPGGTAFTVGAWREGYGMGGVHDLTLYFTEFPDPGGVEVYFSVRDRSLAVDDELVDSGL